MASSHKVKSDCGSALLTEGLYQDLDHKFRIGIAVLFFSNTSGRGFVHSQAVHIS